MNSLMSKIKRILFTCITIIILVIPVLTFAGEGTITYTPIEDIPLVGKQSELTAYLKAIFQFGVAIIAIAATLGIMIGGYLYIFSAGSSKPLERAKSMITDSLLGLGLALISWIIVYTINPDLVELKALREIKLNMKTTDAVLSGGRSGSDAEDILGGNVSDAEKGTSRLCAIRVVKWKKSIVTLKDNSVDIELNLPKECIEKSESPTVQIAVVERGGPMGMALQQFFNEVLAESLDLDKVDMRKYFDFKSYSLPTSGDRFIFNVTWPLTPELKKKLKDNRGYFEDEKGLFIIAQSHAVVTDPEGKKVNIRSDAVASNEALDLRVKFETDSKCDIEREKTEGTWKKDLSSDSIYAYFSPKVTLPCFKAGNILKVEIKSQDVTGQEETEVILKSADVPLDSDQQLRIDVMEEEVKNIKERLKSCIYADLVVVNSKKQTIDKDRINWIPCGTDTVPVL